MTTTDPWFRPVDIKLGPDGALYVADWYDGQTSHIRNQEGQIDRTNGRVYRLRAAGREADRARSTWPKKSTGRAGRAAGRPEPLDPADGPPADRRPQGRLGRARRWRGMVREGTGQLALEALWALNLVGGLDEPTALDLLDHADPYVRLWTVRLPGRPRPGLARGRGEAGRPGRGPSPTSRSGASSPARPGGCRPAEGLPIVRALIGHDEDAADPHLPLLLWWAIEAKAESDREAVRRPVPRPGDFWARPIVRGTIAERLMRRYAAAGGAEGPADLRRAAEAGPRPGRRRSG